MQLSRRSQQKFANLASEQGAVRRIEEAYAAHGFELPQDFEPQEGRARRSVCEAAEAGADLTDPSVAQRLLRVYADGIEDWGRKPAGHSVYGFMASRPPDATPEDPLWDTARVLVRSLRRDGAPMDEEGNLVIGATPPVLPIERFDRLAEPRVLLDHLGRIEAGIDADPAAAIASAKELVESVCKSVLDDYGVAYDKTASLPDLYKAVAVELGLSRDAVPASAKGSKPPSGCSRPHDGGAGARRASQRVGPRAWPHCPEPRARPPRSPRRQRCAHGRGVSAGDLALTALTRRTGAAVLVVLTVADRAPPAVHPQGSICLLD